MRPRSIVAAAALAFVLQAASAAGSEEALRPEVGKPLQAAQSLLKEGRAVEALEKVAEAERISDLRPYEIYILNRMRGSAAAVTGDNQTAVRCFEYALQSGRPDRAERLHLMSALVKVAVRGGMHSKVAEWAGQYDVEAGRTPEMLEAHAIALDAMQDHQGLIRLLTADATSAGTDEQLLNLLARAYAGAGDWKRYVATLERLVGSHPRREYWADLIYQLKRQVPRLYDVYRLDTYRLQRATGALDSSPIWTDFAALALQAGLPAEAKSILEEGFDKGVLGRGTDGAAHRKLLDTAKKQALEDERQLKTAAAPSSADGKAATADALVSVGRRQEGIALMEQALAQGGLKRPEVVRLRIALAEVGGEGRERGLQQLRRLVDGTPGIGDLARLWLLVLDR